MPTLGGKVYVHMCLVDRNGARGRSQMTTWQQYVLSCHQVGSLGNQSQGITHLPTEPSHWSQKIF